MIGTNSSASIKRKKRGAACSFYRTDLKVCLDGRRISAYPDVGAVCEEPEFSDAKRDVVKNPALVVEVLSR